MYLLREWKHLEGNVIIIFIPAYKVAQILTFILLKPVKSKYLCVQKLSLSSEPLHTYITENKL